MGDDNLFPDSPTPDPEADPPTPVNEPDPKPDDGGQMREFMTRLDQTLGSMGDRLTAIEQQAARAQHPADDPASDPPVDPNDTFQRLYTDPVKFVREIAQQDRKSLEPALRMAFDQISVGSQDRARGDFDKQFGEGAWDELIQPDLSAALDKLPPEHRANEQYIRALSAGILGGMYQDPAGREKLSKVETRKREREAPPTMLPGGTFEPPPDKLTREEKDFVGRLEKAGVKFDQKRFLAARNRGNTEEAWGATWMNEDDPTNQPGGKS